jgi:hypothetical protein
VNARNGDSKTQIKDKKDLFNALTDRDIFIKILQKAEDILMSTEYLKEISIGQNNNCIADYSVGIKDYIDLNDLRFY